MLQQAGQSMHLPTKGVHDWTTATTGVGDAVVVAGVGALAHALAAQQLRHPAAPRLATSKLQQSGQAMQRSPTSGVHAGASVLPLAVEVDHQPDAACVSILLEGDVIRWKGLFELKQKAESLFLG